MKPPMTLVELAADLARRLLPAPLYRGLRRKTWMPRANKARKARRFAEAFGLQAEACRRLPCLVCGGRPTVAAHARSRGAGGKDDVTVPLCDPHHREQHDHGLRTFERRHRVDLIAYAALLAAWLRGEHDCDDHPFAGPDGPACAICETPIEDPTA